MRYATVLSLVVISLGVAADARGQERPARPPAPQTRARPPSPEVEQPSDSSASALADSLWQRVASWHAQIARHVPRPWSWVVLASPLWGLLLLVIVVRRVRGRRRRNVSGAGSSAKRSHAERRPATSPKLVEQPVPEVAPLELSAEQQLMIREAGRGASLYETFLLLGGDESATSALGAALSALQLDATAWQAALVDGRLDQAAELRARWVGEVATRRVSGWLARHPLVREAKLTVAPPGRHDAAGVASLSLTRPDGLGLELADRQAQLLARARSALRAAYDTRGDPYALVGLARQDESGVILREQSGGEADRLALAMLCGGEAALARAAAVQLVSARAGRELRAALAEHRTLVDTPVAAEGCAVHACHVVGEAGLPGLGTLLAAIAGAAYSPASVSLRISKHSAALRAAAAQRALTRLGELLSEPLRRLDRGTGRLVLDNMRRLLGAQLVAEEQRRIAAVQRAVQRSLPRAEGWSGRQAPRRPELVLLQLHQLELQHLSRQLEPAGVRLRNIFARLTHAGEDRDDGTRAKQRIGYTVVAFGTEALKGASTELLSTAREALVALRRG